MSVAGQEFDWDVLPEMVFLVGRVPVVHYGAPGTPELAERIDPFIEGHDTLILANHGAGSMGASLDEAQVRMATFGAQRQDCLHRPVAWSSEPPFTG